MFTPQDGLADSLSLLKERKTKFVVSTHAPMEWALGAIAKMGLSDLLPAGDIYSQDHPLINGMRKDRDPETFHVVLGHMGTTARRTAFLDDSHKNHIIARTLGLHTVHVHWQDQEMKPQSEYVVETSHGPVPFLRKLLG